jgi:hypothetical protein
MNRKILIATFIILISAGLVLFNKSEPIKAGTGHNVSGWAWSENIGWISFNNINNPGGGTTNYGVNVNIINNSYDNISGYAWSENIGWIKFDPAGPYPSNHPGNPNHSAKVEKIGNATTVTGWARACAGTINGDCNSATRNDGWDGWISLSGSNYKVELKEDADGCYLDGYAWGSDVVGWIQFNGTTKDGNTYRVKVPCLTIVGTPRIKSIDDPDDYCTNPFGYTITWNPVSEANYYEIKICKNSDINNCGLIEENDEIENKPDTISYTINGNLSYNTKYYVFVRAKKVDGTTFKYSNWSKEEFTTKSLDYYPYDITITTPSTISVGEEVGIQGDAKCYGGCSWQWYFENFGSDEYTIKEGVTTNQQNIYVTFNKAFDSNSNRKITLEVTDSQGHLCPLSKQINVKPKWPTWVEVKPF